MLSIYMVLQGRDNVIYNATPRTLEIKLQGTVKHTILKFSDTSANADTAKPDYSNFDKTQEIAVKQFPSCDVVDIHMSHSICHQSHPVTTLVTSNC